MRFDGKGAYRRTCRSRMRTDCFAARTRRTAVARLLCRPKYKNGWTRTTPNAQRSRRLLPRRSQAVLSIPQGRFAAARRAGVWFGVVLLRWVLVLCRTGSLRLLLLSLVLGIGCRSRAALRLWRKSKAARAASPELNRSLFLIRATSGLSSSANNTDRVSPSESVDPSFGGNPKRAALLGLRTRITGHSKPHFVFAPAPQNGSAASHSHSGQNE